MKPFALLAFLLAVSASAQDYSVVDLAQAVSDEKYKEGLVIAGTLKSDGATDGVIDYYMGICQMNNGQPQDALKSFDAAVASDSLNTWYYDALITACTATGHNERLAPLYNRILEINPAKYNTPATLCRVADLELVNFQDSAALAHYRKAYEIDPSYYPALVGMAEAYRYQRNTPAFLVTIDRIVSDEYLHPMARVELMRTFLPSVDARMFKSWGKQIDVIVRHCAAVQPVDSTCIKIAASWFYSTGRKEDGKAYYRKYAELFPDIAEPHLILIELKAVEGDYKGAIESSLQLLSKDVKDLPKASVYSNLGDFHIAIGDKKKAFKYYEKSLELRPDHPSTLNNYAYNLSLQRKNLAKAEKMSARAIELDPDNAVFLDTYGWVLYLRNKLEQARKQFKRAMVYGGKDEVEILLHYAKVLEALGEKDVAAYYRNIAEKKQK